MQERQLQSPSLQTLYNINCACYKSGGAVSDDTKSVTGGSCMQVTPANAATLILQASVI